MKTKLFLLIVGISGLFISGCEDPNIVVTEDPIVQYLEDIDLINDYLAEKGYTYDDTTNAGVRVVVLDEGTGTPVEENAILRFDYTTRLLYIDSLGNLSDTTHLASTMQDVADEHGLNPDDPINYTYSSNGWTLLSIVTGVEYIAGFREGVTSIMGLINEDGYGEIVIPSASAYGIAGNSSVNPNTVLIFEIYLRDVRL